MKKATPFLTITALAAALYCNVAAADKLAFLVGNQNYENDKPLRNPAHDVELLAERLRRIGFTVLPPLYNQGRTTLIDGLRELHNKIKPGDTVLVYFSGHGLQYQGENYLVPVDANIALANEIPDEAVGGSRVLSYLEEAGVKIVILDACRNNPYRSAGKGIGKGLGRQDASAVNNTLLAFAAAPGEEAQDGSGQYSPYVQALADAIVQPGQTLEQVFKTVRKSVREATGGEQEPWYNASLEDDLYLAGASKPSSNPPAPAPAVVTAIPSQPQASTDRYGIKLIPVTGGCFQMGSPSGEAGRYRDERQHEVCVDSFKLGETEVTQGQWLTVMGGNPSNFKNCGDNCPVESVSWQDVQTFITKLNSQTGQHYRLPSESEWEYAARAGDPRATYNGNLTIKGDYNAPELDAIAWYGGNSGVAYGGGYDCSGWDGKHYPSTRCGPHPVAGKRANAWGFYDLLGNVYEWTGSEWQENYDGRHENASKDHATDSAKDIAHLAVRGGSWFNNTQFVRSANRSRYTATNRNFDLGFRLAQD